MSVTFLTNRDDERYENRFRDIEIAMDNDTSVSSWHDLTDRPFYDEMKEIVYDGTLIDKEYIEVMDGMYYVKVSDVGAEFNELIGASVTFASGGIEETLTIAETDLTEPTEGAVVYTYTDLGMMLLISVNADSVEMDGLVGTRGIYVLRIEGDGGNSASVSNIKYGSIKTIDPKFLPKIDGLPEVTTANNGCILRVVDGAWELVEVANAEDGEY